MQTLSGLLEGQSPLGVQDHQGHWGSWSHTPFNLSQLMTGSHNKPAGTLENLVPESRLQGLQSWTRGLLRGMPAQARTPSKRHNCSQQRSEPRGGRSAHTVSREQPSVWQSPMKSIRTGLSEPHLAARKGLSQMPNCGLHVHGVASGPSAWPPGRGCCQGASPKASPRVLSPQDGDGRVQSAGEGSGQAGAPGN